MSFLEKEEGMNLPNNLLNENEDLLNDFFKFVFWSIIERLVLTLTPTKRNLLHEKLLISFKNALIASVTEEDIFSFMKPTFDTVDIDDALQQFIVNSLTTFTKQFRKEVEIDTDIKERIEDIKGLTAEWILITFFDRALMETVFTLLTLRLRNYELALHIRAFIIEIFKAYITEEITFEEAHDSIELLLEENNIDFTPLVLSFILPFLDTIRELGKLKIAHALKTKIPAEIPLSQTQERLDDPLLIFECYAETVNVTLAFLQGLNLEIDLEKIKENTLTGFRLVMEGLLTIDDFEKRVKQELEQIPQLPDANKAHIIASIVASAELIYAEKKEDPTLAQFSKWIAERIEERNKLYI
ncbi:MAG: hypothetical protein ACFFA5_03735 [Promethearchaeota archaeon]